MKLANVGDLERYGIRPVPIGMMLYSPMAPVRSCRPVFQRVTLRHPMRVNSMLLDYTRFVSGSAEQWTAAGSIAFGVDLCRVIEVQITDCHDGLDMEGFERSTIVRHAVLLMRQALGVRDGVKIISNYSSARSHV